MVNKINEGDNQKESSLRSWLTKNLKKRGCLHYPVDTGARSGEPDIVGLFPDGRFYAIECKVKGGRLSKLQAEKIKGIKKAGGVAVVIASKKQAELFFLQQGLHLLSVAPKKYLKQQSK